MLEEVDPLLKLLPKEQCDAVFNQPMCDIEPVFLGFTKIYKNLSQIIPKNFTVIDLGCAYNPQCFYFTEHKRYIAVDSWKNQVFKSENCEVYFMTIKQFIQRHLKDYDLNETFAICSYVPPWGDDNMKLVRDNFINVFTYYPHGGFKPINNFFRIRQ